MTRWLAALATLGLCVCAARPSAQNPAVPGPTFEVASIKPNKSADPNVRINIQAGGRFTTVNTPLLQLVRFAYQLQGFQLVGGPDWSTSDRFDIVAKAEGEITPTAPGTLGPIQMMMRALLADRFKLVVHQEQRELPIYALVLARSDGRLGPQLSKSTVDCQAMMTASISRGAPPPPNAANGRPVCGMRSSGGSMMGGGFPLSQLASSLAGMVQRTVVDKTGLAGDYDLTLTFTPEQGGQGGRDGAPVDQNGPSIFTALQEQLGLKLEAQRGSVEVLVIDSAQKPIED